MQADIERIAQSSSHKLWGAVTSYAYQTSAWLGRLRLHVFWREDPGEAFHNHPWAFTTLPLRAYVEQVLDLETGAVALQVVPAWRRSRRPALHTHRVLGRWAGTGTDVRPGAVVTLCWRGAHERSWEYVVPRGSKVHSFNWRRYLEKMDDVPRRQANG